MKKQEKKESYYYNIFDDIERYPGCWIYIAVGGRNTGKTYGTLWNLYDRKVPFIFLKRTMDDVDLITTDNGNHLDFSPYKSINRDKGTKVYAEKIKTGIGLFREDKIISKMLEDGTTQETKEPRTVGTLLALSAVSKYKGFDMYENEYIVFDEFIKRKWERGGRDEGEQLLDLYKTVSRDRVHRGMPPLRIICLANATEINNPLFRTLDIIDDVARINNGGVANIKDRGIFVRMLKMSTEFMEVEKNDLLYTAMKDTQWGSMTFENKFSYNDFSNIRKEDIKGYVPVAMVLYENDIFYIYRKGSKMFLCNIKTNKDLPFYDLSLDSDKLKFYNDYNFELKNSLMYNQLSCQKYKYYDLVINMRKILEV